MCLYPKLIQNKKYLPNKKNNYNPPICDDERKKFVPAGCGKCIECMKQKKREWQVRLTEELKTCNNAIFITLSFSEESLVKLEKYIKHNDFKIDIEENDIATTAIRLFLERWRKRYKKSVKHWLITELGHENTERIHIHGILFNTNINTTELTKIWQYGIIYIGDYVGLKTINYITKYCTKIDQKHKGYTPKIMVTPGIGAGYMNRIDWKNNIYKENSTNECYQLPTGQKIALPVYYRNKIYTENEREKLWIKKLDKEIRYICGEKINIKNGEEQYENILKWHQEKNKRLGYGDDTREWSKEEYRKQRNKIKYEKYIKKMQKKLTKDTTIEEIMLHSTRENKKFY